MPELAGDTATNDVPAAPLLVLREGDFDRDPVTLAQLDCTATAFTWAAQRFHLDGAGQTSR